MTKAKKKTIFLGDEKKMLKYETIEKLKKEADKYGISIGANATIGDWVFIDNNAVIGNGVTIANHVDIGKVSIIGNGATLDNNVYLGDFVTIGDGITILRRAKIRYGWTIEDIVHLKDEYKYHVSGYIIYRKIIIQLGRYTRTLEDWEEDFWNNDEFKKGTPEGEERWRAFEKIKKIMEQKIKDER